MRKLLTIFLGILLVACCISCQTERMVCPAYQSAFIYDKDALAKRFSYFGEDSLPKVLEASKDKYLIIEKMPYRKKVRSLATIEMKPIYPIVDDSVAFAGDTEQMTELDLIDSVALDSMSLLPPWEEKFNVEQENYLYYFNEILVYPDERAALEAADAKMKEIEAEQQEKQGFFKRLFGKKKKGDEPGELKDSLIGDEEGDKLDDSEGEETPKKGIFGKKKKKNKNKAISPAVEETEGDEDKAFVPPTEKPVKKKKKKKKKKKEQPAGEESDAISEEEEDDGF